MATSWPSCRRSAVADVRLLAAPFDPAVEQARFQAAHAGAGGIASVLGSVRPTGGVEALELSHYEPLTLPGMESLVAGAVARWRLEGALVIHRSGMMHPGDPIVLVCCAAAHRREAFEATDYLMDHLKSESWFWKREKVAGQWRWVEPREADYADKARWR